MKKFIVILLSNFIFTISFAQTDAAYRIFGEIMTVENKVYKGFQSKRQGIHNTSDT